MNKLRIYGWMMAVWCAGVCWLWYASHGSDGPDGGWQACLFKRISGIPCPSCGITRAMLVLLGGDITAALQANPLVLVALAAMLLVPVWILYDVLFHKTSFYTRYRQVEVLIAQQRFAVPLVLAVLASWGWNIWKAVAY